MLNRFRIVSTSDFDEFRASGLRAAPDSRTWEQTEKTPFRGEIALIRFGDASGGSVLASSSTMSGILVGGHPQDVIRVVSPTTAALSITCGSQSRALSGIGRAGLLPAREMSMSLSAGHHWTVHVDRRRVAEAMRQFECDADIDTVLSDFYFDPRLGGLRELAARIRQVVYTFDNEPDAMIDLPAYRACHDQMLVIRLAYILSAAARGGRWRSVGRNSAALDRARDFIVAHAAQPLDLTRVAGHAGVSLRSLEVLFRDAFDCTVVQYVKQHRLASARKRLEDRACEESVAEIARQSGFTHLGHFSRSYKAAFGEQPRTTLQRARRAGHAVDTDAQAPDTHAGR